MTLPLPLLIGAVWIAGATISAWAWARWCDHLRRIEPWNKEG